MTTKTKNKELYDKAFKKEEINILREALKITGGDRQNDYGSAKENFEQIARLSSTALGKELSAKDIVIIMLMVKIARECHKSKTDNHIDIAGYSHVLHEVVKDEL